EPRGGTCTTRDSRPNRLTARTKPAYSACPTPRSVGVPRSVTYATRKGLASSAAPAAEIASSNVAPASSTNLFMPSFLVMAPAASPHRGRLVPHQERSALWLTCLARLSMALPCKLEWLARNRTQGRFGSVRLAQRESHTRALATET